MRAGCATRAAGGATRAAALCATLAAILSAAPTAWAGWSAPADPAGCAAALPSAAPLIVFPSSSPQSRSGPGALLWDAPRGCRLRSTSAGALGTGPAEAFGATLSPEDLPGQGVPLAPGGGGLESVAAAAGTAAGQVVAAGQSAAAGQVVAGQAAAGAGQAVAGASAGVGALAEGRRAGAFALRSLGAPGLPVGVSSGYLGDTVLASPVHARRGGWAIAVRVQRHYSSAFATPRVVPVGAVPVNAVAAAMDYRADILLAWASRGSVYARVIAAAGTLGVVRKLGSVGVEPRLGALISDDGHTIVAWSSRFASPGGGTLTTLDLSLCAANPNAVSGSCGARIVERFRDLPGHAPPVTSLRLIRLSSEAVMMAWTGASSGRYVVRASPVSLHRGAWAPVTISGTSAQKTLLADLVPGPHAEALALWTTDSRAILAARGHYAGAGEVAFAAPETVASPGPNGTPAAAFDPETGEALAAWVRGGQITYALRPAEPVAVPVSSALSAAVFCCCVRLGGWPYASIESSAMRIGTPLAACLK